MGSMMVAWNADDEIIATFSFMAKRDDDGEVIGHYDFEAHELAGGDMTLLWKVPGAVASATWPEFIGMRAHDFRVRRRPGPKGVTHLITALEHKVSGHRRERVDVEAKLVARRASHKASLPPGQEGVVYTPVGDIVGGPGKPLPLGDDGREMAAYVVGSPDVPFSLNATGAVRQKVKNEMARGGPR